MKRREFLTTSAIGIIGDGVTFPAIAAPGIIARQRPDWAGRDLSGMVLDDVDLAGADLRGCRMHGTTFRRADLRGSLLDDTDIQGTKFDGAQMDGASMQRAAISKSSFRFAGMNALCADQARFDGVHFDSAQMKSVRFRQCEFGSAYFDGAVMPDADFSSSILVQDFVLSMRSAILTGGRFSNLTIRYSDDRLGPTLVYLDGADAAHTDFSGLRAAVLCDGTSFRGANLENADFCRGHDGKSEGYCRCMGADFSHANLRGCNLAPAIFDGVCQPGVGEEHFLPPLFKGADLRNAKITFKIDDAVEDASIRKSLTRRFVDIGEDRFAGAIFGDTRINGRQIIGGR